MLTAIVISLWINFDLRGFIGTDRMLGTALFCSSFHLVDPKDISDPTLGALLDPIISETPVDKLRDGEWIYDAPNGPYRTLVRFYGQNNVHRVLLEIAVESIKRHPIAFLRDRIMFFWETIQALITRHQTTRLSGRVQVYQTRRGAITPQQARMHYI